MTSRLWSSTQKGWHVPAKGYQTYLAIKWGFVAQGLGGLVALAGFGAVWASGSPDWLRVSVAEGLVMGALFACAALFLGVVNWSYMGREVGRRLADEGLVPPLPRQGRRKGRLIFLAVCLALLAVALLEEFMMPGGLTDWRKALPSMTPSFRMPSTAGLWATPCAIALVHLVLTPRGDHP